MYRMLMATCVQPAFFLRFLSDRCPCGFVPFFCRRHSNSSPHELKCWFTVCLLVSTGLSIASVVFVSCVASTHENTGTFLVRHGAELLQWAVAPPPSPSFWTSSGKAGISAAGTGSVSCGGDGRTVRLVIRGIVFVLPAH